MSQVTIIFERNEAFKLALAAEVYAKGLEETAEHSSVPKVCEQYRDDARQHWAMARKIKTAIGMNPAPSVE